MAITATNQTWTQSGVNRHYMPITVTFDSSYDGTNGESITTATLGTGTIVDVWTQGGVARDSVTGKAWPVHVDLASNGLSVTFRCFGYNGTNAGAQGLDHCTDTTNLSNCTIRATLVCLRS